MDKCPNEAETINDYQDEDGCPDEKPAVDVGQSIVLEGVNFASGSTDLTANSERILDKVAADMQKYPEVEIEIRGYTDNTGSYQGNIRISQRRADTVKQYLVRQGIVAYRINTRGVGPDIVQLHQTIHVRAERRTVE